MQELITEGTDVNFSNSGGKTSLHLAAKSGNLDIMKFLIEKGANLNSTDYKGYTPLHLAAKSGNLDIMKLLIEKGADFNAKDNDGKTPLDVAEKGQAIALLSSDQHDNRRDISSNSWINNSIVNGAGLKESPTLITHRGHTATSVPEINTTVVNNTIILGILAAGLFNKTQHRQPTHENPLSPREQLMKSIGNSSRLLEESLQKGEEEGWGSPNTDIDEVEISSNKTGMWK